MRLPPYRERLRVRLMRRLGPLAVLVWAMAVAIIAVIVEQAATPQFRQDFPRNTARETVNQQPPVAVMQG